jgi:hypothetical protein
MDVAASRRKLGAKKEATVPYWIDSLDWFPISFGAIVWFLVMGTVGYAAIIATLRGPHRKP